MFKPTGEKTTGTGTGTGTENCSPYTLFLKNFNNDNTIDSNGKPIPIPIPESNFVKAFNIENNKELEQQRKLFKFSTSINPNKNNGSIMELLPTKKIYSLQSLNDDDNNKTTKFTNEIHSYTYKIKVKHIDENTRNINTITNYKFQSTNISDVHFIPDIITIDKGLSIMCYLNRTKGANERFIKMGFIMYDTIKDFSNVNNRIIIGKCFLLTESMSKNIIENKSVISNKNDDFYKRYDIKKENNLKDFLVSDGQYKQYVIQNIRQKKDTGFLVFSIEVELQQNISQCAWLQNNLINKIGCDDINLKYKDDTAELKKRCMLNNCKYNTNESKCENSYGCYKKCYNYNYDDLIHKKDNSELPKTDYKKLKNTCKSECLLETSKYYEIGNNRVDLDEPKNNYYNQQYCSFDDNDKKCKANCISGNSVEDMVFNNYYS